MRGSRRAGTLPVALLVALAACVGGAPETGTPTPTSASPSPSPSPTPLESPTPTPSESPTPSPLDSGLCDDLRELEQTIRETLAGDLSPVLAVFRLQDILRRLEARSGELAFEAALIVAELTDDVTEAIEEVQRAIREGDDVLGTLADQAGRVASAVGEVVTERC